jgi:cob(I)alamin adenosyltransferase
MSKYKQQMAKKKAIIDKRIVEANIDKNLIVLLTGNGKGKSSSAFGMVARMLGYGKKVAIVKFLKGEIASGEDKLFQKLGVDYAVMQSGFTWDTQDKEADAQKAQTTWKDAKEFLIDKTIDLVVLDEITYMLNYGYLDEEEVIKTLQNRPKNQHIVLTGRAASQNLIELADTVSILKDEKHAFRENIKAQKGVDF